MFGISFLVLSFHLCEILVGHYVPWKQKYIASVVRKTGLKIHANVIISPSNYHMQCKELLVKVGISSTSLPVLDNLHTYVDSLYKKLNPMLCCRLRLPVTWSFIKVVCNTDLELSLISWNPPFSACLAIGKGFLVAFFFSFPDKIIPENRIWKSLNKFSFSSA